MRWTTGLFFIVYLTGIFLLTPGHCRGLTNRASLANIIKNHRAKREHHPLSATFDVTSNYMFRGLSQTMNGPAVQGELTYTLPKIGVYGDLSGSNVKFFDENDTKITREVDLGFGISNKIKDLDYDFSLYRYNYPKSFNIAYNELLASLQWKIVTALYGYSGDVYSTGQNGYYYNLGLNIDIPPHYIFNINGMNLSGGIGHYTLPQSADLQSYNDFNIQLAKTIKKCQLIVAWTDTDGRAVENPAYSGSTVFVTASINFS